jgi:proline dehydrogenase
MFSSIIAKSLPIVPKPIVKAVASRYIAGEDIPSAVRTVRELNAHKAKATVDVLGEFVTSRTQAQEETAMAHRVLDAIHSNTLGSGLSVKLTSLGLDIEDEFCYANVFGIVKRAQEIGRFVRLDMENSPYTTKTIDLYKRLRSDGLDNTGVVIQAYMRRSEDDVRDLVKMNASFRLCKGIYKEAESIALQGYEEVRNNYKKLLPIMMEAGCYVGIATHDDALLDFAREYIAKNKIAPSTYEFQMLLGVREQKRDELIRDGHRMRIYVPFGHDWYGYSVRRLKENPDMAGHIVKAMFGIGQ